MKFLALRLCAHDSNISYFNGEEVLYYKSERDFQIKHHGFNNLTEWTHILKKWNIDPSSIDAIGITIDSFRYPDIECDEETLFEVIKIDEISKIGFECPIYRVDHHYAHKLSVWPLDVETDIDFVYDGFGDDKISHSIFKNNDRILKHKIYQYPSFSMEMSSYGNELDLDGSPLDWAGKIMALKGYSNLTKREQSKLLREMKSYGMKDFNKIWNRERIRHSLSDQDTFNSINISHTTTENIFLKHFKSFLRGRETVSYSGGTAQNTIINSVLKKGIRNLHIPPHCNDEGLSLGILECLRLIYDQPKLKINNFPFCQSDESPDTKVSSNTIKKVAEMIADGKIVGWYQGNGEIGPRALGNRSILMNPSIKNGKQILNDRVKHREWFRPFGCSILEEDVSKYFDWNSESDYMLYVVNILDKTSFPSITHVDNTCRIQTVSPKLDSYYELISEFKNVTGIPMILNTSLNRGGKPICGRKSDAIDFFSESDFDVLVVGDTIYS